MGLRKNLLAHKQKTIESFGLVRTDISSINASIENVKNSLASIDLRLSAFDNEILSLKKYMESSIYEASMQRASALKIQSKIGEIDNSITSTVGTVSSIGDKVNGIFAQNKKISKTMAEHKAIIENLASRTNSQSVAGRKSNAKIKNFEQEARKLRNFVDAKIKTAKAAGMELEKKMRRRIAQLNRKIEGKKIFKKAMTKGRISKKTKPNKKITIIKTPRRTITKTVTKNKITTKKETPTKKEIYQVIREKNPLI